MKIFNKLMAIFLVVFCLFTYSYQVNASGVNMNLTDQTTYGGTTSGVTYSNSSAINNVQQSSSVSISNQNTSEGLTISDMINIVLCAVGVILILLGIAILIRKN